jgi:putative endonuclease
MLHVQDMKQNPPIHKQVGDLGEDIAENYLKNKGFLIIARNYLKKWGEIDIVTRENDIIHFVEVKTVSYETKYDLNLAVSRGTWRPEENVHPWKIKKLNRTIESWLIENSFDGDWQIDVVAVRIVPREKFASVSVIENVI